MVAGETPLRKKLGIADGSRVALVGEPEGFARSLGIPRGSGRAPFDVIVLFDADLEELRARFGELAGRLDVAGGLWVAYPKRSSGVPTDLSFATVQQVGLQAGLVDNKSCAIDDTWTAVRFVVRLADRAAWPRS